VTNAYVDENPANKRRISAVASRNTDHSARGGRGGLGAELDLFFLLPYSPKLNPDELLRSDPKIHGTRRKPIISLMQLLVSLCGRCRCCLLSCAVSSMLLSFGARKIVRNVSTGRSAGMARSQCCP
jgi:hypothetical protein